jgi:hypothetical protein
MVGFHGLEKLKTSFPGNFKLYAILPALVSENGLFALFKQDFHFFEPNPS